jgi:hypothetical protein
MKSGKKQKARLRKMVLLALEALPPLRILVFLEKVRLDD